MHCESTHRPALHGFARAWCGVLPLKEFEEIVPPLPCWLPLPAAAALDEKPCTDSVLPGVSPVRLHCASGFVTASLPHSRIFPRMPDGAVPCPRIAAQFFNADRPDCITAGFAHPSRASSRVCGPGKLPGRKPRRFTAEDPVPPPLSGGAAGILPKTYARGPQAAPIGSCPGVRGAADHPHCGSS